MVNFAKIAVSTNHQMANLSPILPVDLKPALSCQIGPPIVKFQSIEGEGMALFAYIFGYVMQCFVSSKLSSQKLVEEIFIIFTAEQKLLYYKCKTNSFLCSLIKMWLFNVLCFRNFKFFCGQQKLDSYQIG